jgi:signal transduction histidine kinase
MLSKLSIRWRLTLLSTALLTVCCVGLTCVINWSAYKMVDVIDATMITTYAIDSSIPEQNELIQEMTPSTPSEEISTIKRTFSLQSLIYMLIVILGGSALTHYAVGRALRPLTKLNNQVKNINIQNLSDSMDVPETKDEIAELTQSFNEMTNKLEDAFKTQERFSANAAHELRTPLTVLQTKLDVFKKSSTHTDDEYQKIIATFEKQVERLRHLITVLLDMANIENNTEQDTVNLQDVLEDIVSELTPVAEKSKVTLSINCDDITVIGNLDLLYRAFYNLVENGIKYNKKNGTVAISAKQLSNNRVEILIADTGIGIPNGMKKQIFEPFFRVDKSRSREMGGAGLGLAMVDSIIKKHKGNISVTDTKNGGSCFKIEL